MHLCKAILSTFKIASPTANSVISVDGTVSELRDMVGEECLQSIKCLNSIRPVWSESSLSAWRNIGSSATPPFSELRRLWSGWADAQADLSLRWAHMSFCWFCHEAADLLLAYWFMSLFCVLTDFLYPNPRYSGTRRSVSWQTSYI